MGLLSGIASAICVPLLIGFPTMQSCGAMRSSDLITPMALAERFDAATAVIDLLRGIGKATGARNAGLLEPTLRAPLVALERRSALLTCRKAVSLDGSMAWISRRLSALAVAGLDNVIRPGRPDEIGETADAVIRLCDADRAAADKARVQAQRTASDARLMALRAGEGAAKAALARGALTAHLPVTSSLAGCSLSGHWPAAGR